MGLAALAAVERFGGGLAIGGSDSCGSGGFFGNCQDQSKANAESVRRLVEFENSLTDYVTEIITNANDKIFLVEKELAALNAIQYEIATTQDGNWVIMKEQLFVYDQSFHSLCDAIAINIFSPNSNFILFLILSVLYSQWFMAA